MASTKVSAEKRKVDLIMKFRDDNPQKFIKYLRALEGFAAKLRVAFEECAHNDVFAGILMNYVKLMADTPEMVDIDPDARILLNDRILFLRRMFAGAEPGAVAKERLRKLVKRIVRARGTTKYAEVAW
jgi:hypothetical protein